MFCGNRDIVECGGDQPSMAAILRGFVEIDEGQVLFRTLGPESAKDTRPLLMFHPSPSSSLFLMPLIQELGLTRRVIAFDTLGQGDSCSPSNNPSSMTEIADALYRAFMATNYAHPHFDLFGTHTGARIAIEMSLQHVEQVSHLIIDGMGISDGFYQEYARYVDLSSYIDQDGTQFVKAWQRMRDGYIFWPPYQRSVSNLRQRGLPTAGAMHAEAIEIFKGITTSHITYQAALEYPAGERLPQIRVPTLVTCAREDTPYRFQEDVAALIPGSTRLDHPGPDPIDQASTEDIEALCRLFISWLDC